ncbi:MAG: hypothetical protein HOE90_08685 [Bacteriovoracaceae bacterium]|jgi:hypothetical protein|nr:hypothetical protein [Bacteriovoracaceae bacterium]
MSTNSIDEILKKKGIDSTPSESVKKPKKRRRRLYEALDEEPALEKLEVKSLAEPEEKTEESSTHKIIEPKQEIIASPVEERRPEGPVIKRIVVKKPKKKAKQVLSKKLLENALPKPTKEFTIIHNQVLEKIVLSNLNVTEMRFLLLILRKTLGWNKQVAYLSRPEISTEGNIKLNRFDACRNNLLENGIIGVITDPKTRKNGFFLRADFFGIATNNNSEKPSSSSIDNDNVSKVLAAITDDAIREKESKVVGELVAKGHELTEIGKLGLDLIEKGDLKGTPCIHPFSYLNSGTIDAIRNRVDGKNSRGVNANLIWEAISRFDANTPLPDDFQETLSETDLSWINDRGGRRQLGQMNANEVKKELGLSL